MQARINVWARKIQVEQSKEAFERESARLKTGFSDVGTRGAGERDVPAIPANRIAAEADVLTSEGTLRNLLGLPPDDDQAIMPTSAPTTQRLHADWDGLLRLAEQRRPDIVELKLIIEADQQRLIQAENQALPQLNAVALYRWNGLSGTMPNGVGTSSTRPGQFTDWSARPSTSRCRWVCGRAGPWCASKSCSSIRTGPTWSRELHARHSRTGGHGARPGQRLRAVSGVQGSRAWPPTSTCKCRSRSSGPGQTIYLNVLQALNDWGNAVSSEAQQLLIYNTALATLERQTGTILETHGLVFAEERFRRRTASAPPPIPLRPAAGRFAATVPQHGIAVGEFVQLAESGCARRENTWRAVAAAAVGLNP